MSAGGGFPASQAEAVERAGGADRVYVASISGGTGSYLAARRHVDQHGVDGLVLLFTDTLIEDQDCYRFLIASAANLFGITLPNCFLPEIDDFPRWEDRPLYKAYVLTLAARVRDLMPDFHWIADGRDPWDVYESRRFLGNSQRDPCSETLKRLLSRRWLAENCDPVSTTVLLGIDHEESDRFYGSATSAGYRARMAKDGWLSDAPLLGKPWLFPSDRLARLDAEGLWEPRLNRLGFAHNNCGGHCSKAGQGHWRKLFEHFPERYAYCEAREASIRDILGDVSMLTDRRGGGGKKPLTLGALRERDLTPEEASDMGGCRCFTGPDLLATLPEGPSHA